MRPDHRNPEVDAFLAALVHSRKDEVQLLRLAILNSEPEVTETIKWNAPNFRFGGEDRVTFRLHPRDQVQIIVHRGVQVRRDQDEFVFDDPEGLLRWLSKDRAVITLADARDTHARLLAVTDLIGRWIRS